MPREAGPLILEPPGEHRGTVIWLHGLGASGHDLAPIVEQFAWPEGHGIRCLFPHAPSRPVTINGGVHMPAWYDLLGLEAGCPEDEAGIRDSSTRLHELVQQECAAGLRPTDIVLAGFSQGGALALYAGLGYPQRLAGLLILSGWLPLANTLHALGVRQASTPIMMMHGRDDDIVAVQYGSDSRDRLREAGHAVSWQDYSMAHAICQQQLADIDRWLRTQLEGAI